MSLIQQTTALELYRRFCSLFPASDYLLFLYPVVRLISRSVCAVKMMAESRWCCHDATSKCLLLSNVVIAGICLVVGQLLHVQHGVRTCGRGADGSIQRALILTATMAEEGPAAMSPNTN